ncbi:PLP-dependent aminotransferase family protein [Aquitalea denitrificans]|uniref:aminotransferase-like domain-containing protein n=1 Tax=Aquitalea denitrificans TaxID=519081 RepID=UPI001F0DBA93|nr:PLP-dependent aminotransferase family protein [Aquitalea denitrificans]
MAPGTRLATHRQLAAQEGLALVTASRIYAELETMGLVSGEAGRGTFVRDTSLTAGHGIDQHPVGLEMVDLNFNNPSLPEQTDLLRDAMRQLASAGDLSALLRYQPHGGRPHERAIMARHLESRGVQVSRDNVLIVNGAQHGLTVCAMALLKPGDVIAVDALTYPGFKVLAEVLHLELLPIPVTPEGPDLATLRMLCTHRRVRAVYAMPTLHNPLGWVIDEARRKELVAIARSHDLILIEDAAYAFLACSPPPPLQALAPERTLYVSGLSKNVATGLRVGLVVAPSHWMAAIERSIRATTWNTPSVMTALVCGWIEDGTVARFEQNKRLDAAERQKIASSLLSDIPFLSHPASYFLWVPLGEDVRAEQIVSDLLRENIAVSNAEPYSTSKHVPHALRLALGSVEMETLHSSLQTVGDVIRRYTY